MHSSYVNEGSFIIRVQSTRLRQLFRNRDGGVLDAKGGGLDYKNYVNPVMLDYLATSCHQL